MEFWEVRELVRMVASEEPSLLVALALLLLLAWVTRKWWALHRRHEALKAKYEEILDEVEATGLRRERELFPAMRTDGTPREISPAR